MRARTTGIEAIQAAMHRFDMNIRGHAGDRFPRAISNSVKQAIVDTGSIDTGRMISAVDYYENVVSDIERHFEVGTQSNDEVTYDGFVDQPGETRNWAGRFFYRQGIERADIEGAATALVDESFVI